MADTTEASHVHAFRALGAPPYRYLGYQRLTFQAIPGDPNCPIQAGGSCDHCGTAICDSFAFISADGHRFKVGSTCVGRSGDAGLKRVISRDVAKHRRDVVEARASRLIAEADAALPGLRETFASQPHPNEWRAAKGATRLDWIEWMTAHAGRTGKVEVARFILAAAA